MNDDAQFTPESIRTILENPFYAGLIAQRPRPEFSMEDDIEHPENIPAPRIDGNPREILELFQGVHQPLISVEMWQAVRDLCSQKASTPSTSTNQVRAYPLSGIGRCWECFEATGREFTLRGSTGGTISYYRCAYVHDHELKRKAKQQPRIDGLNPLVTKQDASLKERHKTLRADKMEPQVDAIMSRLVIKPEWHETIMAYYLSDEGMSDFEREGHNLRQTLKRYKDLHLVGHISTAELDQQARVILQRLDAFKPSARAEAAEIAPWLHSFPSTWQQFTSGEKRTLLHILFVGLYFDRNGILRKAAAHEPFDELLGLPNGGIFNQ